MPHFRHARATAKIAPMAKQQTTTTINTSSLELESVGVAGFVACVVATAVEVVQVAVLFVVEGLVSVSAAVKLAATRLVDGVSIMGVIIVGGALITDSPFQSAAAMRLFV
jgi:hypothetical protein